ncbi:MAG: C1 family peptidase [Candidatus Limnocylindrales bacterium]
MIPLAHDGTEDEIEDRLSRDVPVLVIVEVTKAFEIPDNEGHIQTPSLTAGPGDYHAVLAVGAATHPTHGRRLLVRNSWGPYWGLGGYGWLPLDYLVSFAVQAGAVIIPSPSALATTTPATLKRPDRRRHSTPVRAVS